MAQYLNDGSRHDSVTYFILLGVGDWRRCADGNLDRCVLPEVLAAMAGKTHGYRYLEPEHLVAPWTPTLLLHLHWAWVITKHYQAWSEAGEFRDPWWGTDTSDTSLPKGERVFQIALHDFQAAGLTDFIPRIEAVREMYRKRVAWMTSGVHWVPFQVDINSPSLFLTITGPDMWQVVVDTVVADPSHDISFLREMRMASVEYLEKEIPPDYGVSTEIPSFGYRREHRTDIVFAGWAAAHMPDHDLFGTGFWPAP